MNTLSELPKVVDKKERALQLAKAATKVFARKGFAATRMEDVAKQAGVSKGLLYEYYRSKEDLFFEVCDRLVAQRPLAGGGDPPSDIPKALIDQVASNYDWSPDFFLVLVDYWAQILKGSPKQRRKYLAHVDSFYADRRREIAEFLAKARSPHDVRQNPHVIVLANLVIACIEGIHMQDFLCTRGARKTEVLTMLARLIRDAGGLRAD